MVGLNYLLHLESFEQQGFEEISQHEQTLGQWVCAKYRTPLPVGSGDVEEEAGVQHLKLKPER